MKKYIFILLALFSLQTTVDVSAQSSFVKKLGKSVGKEVSKEVKKRVNKGSSKSTKEQQQTETQQVQSQSSQTQATSNTKSSTNKQTEIKKIDPMIPYGPLKGKINGHEWVDLGLPSGTRWATCNVDATSSEQPGKHYAWGEIATKTTYSESTSKQYHKDISDVSGNKAYDVATVKWGKGWRMPTVKEFKELEYYCTDKYVQKSGRYGREFTGPNGNTIFLPATGSKDGTKLEEANGCGSYWTSTPYSSATNNGAHDYHFGAALGEMGIAERYYGFAVRPVADYDVNTEIPFSGETNGHKWVDLGLPSGLKWATCNVGTDKVDQDGDLYAWGQVTTFLDKDSKKNKMSTEKTADIDGYSTYDAARAVWGGTWRLPKKKDFDELLENCTCEWTRIGRRNGMKLTSKINGNYIFLPASGYSGNNTDYYGIAYDINKYGRYWTSTPARPNYDSYYLNISETNIYVSENDRNKGLYIRPVTK